MNKKKELLMRVLIYLLCYCVVGGVIINIHKLMLEIFMKRVGISSRRPPSKSKELLNLRHSKARNVVEILISMLNHRIKILRVPIE